MRAKKKAVKPIPVLVSISTQEHAQRIRLARLGPALGVHAGPGILFVALRGRALS
jgi:hypothetical protein